jgi:hypothetical protein
MCAEVSKQAEISKEFDKYSTFSQVLHTNESIKSNSGTI